MLAAILVLVVLSHAPAPVAPLRSQTRPPSPPESAAPTGRRYPTTTGWPRLLLAPGQSSSPCPGTAPQPLAVELLDERRAPAPPARTDAGRPRSPCASGRHGDGPDGAGSQGRSSPSPARAAAGPSADRSSPTPYRRRSQRIEPSAQEREQVDALLDAAEPHRGSSRRLDGAARRAVTRCRPG